MRLVLTEKPNVAKEFAAALRCGEEKGCFVSQDYVIVPASGHLIELCEPADYNPQWKSWSLESLPMIPSPFRWRVIDQPNVRTRLETIKRALNEFPIESVVIATDSGREGELIGRSILNYLKVDKPLWRFWTSKALNPDVIREEMEHLKPATEFDRLYDQAKLRSQIDWLVGMNYSRFVSLKAGAKYPFGRVQSALAKLVYDRDAALSGFQKSFFYANAVFSGDVKFSFLSENQKNEAFSDEQRKAEAEAIGEKLLSAVGKSFPVSLTEKEKSIAPPHLLSLNDLQKSAADLYGYSADRTLELAQSLYDTHKALTYPRTSSRYMTENDVSFFEACLSFAAPEVKVNPSDKRIFDGSKVEDHHALLVCDRPTEAFSPEERNVYNIVAASMRQATGQPALIREQKAAVEIDGIQLKAKRNVVVDEGWRRFRISSKSEEAAQEDEEKETGEAFAFRDGDLIPIEKAEIETKEKKPPQRYKESELLSVMEKYGLGTAATQAGIIKKIITYGYAERVKNRFAITDFGKQFIGILLQNEHLSQLIEKENTNRFESAIESGANLIDLFFDDFDRVMKSDFSISRPEKKPLGKCPVCGADVFEGTKNFYCSASKKDHWCFSLFKTFLSAKITELDVRMMLSGKYSGLKKMKSKDGKDFAGYLRILDDGKIDIRFINQKGRKK